MRNKEQQKTEGPRSISQAINNQISGTRFLRNVSLQAPGKTLQRKITGLFRLRTPFL